MSRVAGRLDAAVLCGVGQAFDLLAGRRREAPSWMQRRGLEWLFRAGQEPRRLIPRYAYSNPRYVAAIARELRAQRRS
jgi:N-acetylglucosaminyldiphosphoundecaprenol N-acetyl-beta-D-mannosaminyltransferase